MSIQVVDLTINSFSSSQECSSFTRYPCQLAEVHRDRHTNAIDFSYGAVHVSLVQSNFQIDASQ